VYTGGADVNHGDGRGNTALYYALEGGYYEAYVRLLLQYGANPCAVNETGRPLLACAADHVDVSTVRLLVHAIDDRRLPRLLNYRLNSEGETPLCRACRKGDLTRASFLLLELDADYKMKDFANNTPLQKAIRYGNLQCAELIQVRHLMSTSASRRVRLDKQAVSFMSCSCI
jgi:ankyrin repeat protein